VARAHQRYGRLLWKDQKWTDSAEQLISSCDITVKSGTYDAELVELLEKDSEMLFALPGFKTEAEHRLTEKIREALANTHNLRHTSPQIEQPSVTAQNSRMGNPLPRILNIHAILNPSVLPFR